MVDLKLSFLLQASSSRCGGARGGGVNVKLCFVVVSTFYCSYMFPQLTVKMFTVFMHKTVTVISCKQKLLALNTILFAFSEMKNFSASSIANS